MPNKIIIIVLTFLLVVIGALGAYSFNLNKEIVALTLLQEDTNHQISSIQGSIYSLDTKIASFKDDIASQITGTEDAISALSAKNEDIASQITSTEDAISANAIGIGELDDTVSAISAKIFFSPSPVDTEGLYQQAKGSVVEIRRSTWTGQETGSGSGFVFDDEGYIVTAYHVVEDANRIDIILHDGTISAASVVGYCIYSDIAVLKPEKAMIAEGLSLADSNATAIGEPVIAIGSPFELAGTVTSGIISQKDRYIEVEYNENELRWVANIIQCDASVNSGNSGGPLINAEGDVIGVVIARIDPQEGDGIYYAVSSNKLKRVATSIIDYGYFDYPWLGIGITDLSPQEARWWQLDTINGAQVTATLDGPAAPAGVKVDDIIVAIDDTTIYNTAELTSYLGEYTSPQESVTLTIIRNGKELKLSVQLNKRS